MLLFYLIVKSAFVSNSTAHDLKERILIRQRATKEQRCQNKHGFVSIHIGINTLLLKLVYIFIYVDPDHSSKYLYLGCLTLNWMNGWMDGWMDGVRV